MPHFRVLLTDYAWADLQIERQLLSSIGAELVAAASGDAHTLCAAAADADAILTCWARVSAEVLQAAPRCQIISRLGIGLDNIDVPEATRLGIVVTNVPDYCLAEVAEHTLALLLALARHVGRFHLDTKRGVYALAALPPPHRLAGQTLGIVGLGRLGAEVARRAAALGMRVVAAESRSARPLQLPGVVRLPLSELLAQSDFVSLHLPWTPQTDRLMGAEQFRLMKPTAYLINTARGGLVDHAALAEALREGWIAGAALDVQQPEPPDLSQPPFNDPRVIVTPHAAFSSVESLRELRSRATQHVVDCLSGRRPPCVVNPEVYERPATCRAWRAAAS
jgi:D-3-phosphoglycerate dehydrogenase